MPLSNLEVDPLGVQEREPGYKPDAGKPDVALLFESFPRALMEVASVATFGLRSHTRDGFRYVKDKEVRYEAAMGRHMLKRHMGELVDPDSKHLHRTHEVWNALALLEFELTQQEEPQCPKD